MVRYVSFVTPFSGYVPIMTDRHAFTHADVLPRLLIHDLTRHGPYSSPVTASRFGLEVHPLGVYPLRPRSSACGPTKGALPPRTTLRTI